MFFSSAHGRKQQPSALGSAEKMQASEQAQPEAQHLEDWRRSAQKVNRAWNAWLAAEARERSNRYRAYVAALADEELAAACVEQTRRELLVGPGESRRKARRFA